MAVQRSGEEQVIMTREGYEKLKQELASLRGDGRSEIASKLEEARAFGDLSENAEYHAAKEEQEKLESRIMWLEYQLSKAKVVESSDIDTSTVSLGATVQLRDLDTGNTYTYVLVGSEEADPKANRISAQSPVGKAIIGRAEGEEVIVRVPKGTRHLRIERISVS
ncbi:transcription elongation factor GreA [Thermanaerovibrio acidaminovorans DSM 6589]|uniref:Transcription elongation factor GreA n=1 Tax=Thermanaerovibrio acidaminovorans (strain ATCC 49978 / DSM 6589 / Su883) TaxID=525903 RepID=D1B632_THEAS|nr:transcription elongation factor GreA [Thermanaerovibrio acidaminovorans]ACZ19473.1 transcription elongation factor GreA [Thermanaerovibrio acidaminovorans DSM 6589]